MVQLKSKPKRKGPLWGGPEKEGITQSLLGRFLNCRERFRLLVVEGLSSDHGFNHYIEYGNLWHICEEFHAKNKAWGKPLEDYVNQLLKRYPFQQDQIFKWYNVCKIQFPVYVKYWSKQQDVKDRTPLFQEQVFNVSYPLFSGRVVKMKGKWDSVDVIGKGKSAGIYLQENKTKSEVDEKQLNRQLSFDLQTMWYLVALQEYAKRSGRQDDWNELSEQSAPIKGIRYNVIRRPLSGGKGSIVQHKPTKKNPKGETLEHYYGRLKAIIEASPSDYFMRWKIEVTPGDVEKFRREFLDPVLENLCWWWDDINGIETDYPPPPSHWRHPFGCRNYIDEGGISDLDAYLATGSMTGLTRVSTLFPEL